jgi:hypothetical protein
MLFSMVKSTPQLQLMITTRVIFKISIFFRMNGKWSGNSFLLGSSSLANQHGG